MAKHIKYESIRGTSTTLKLSSWKCVYKCCKKSNFCKIYGGRCGCMHMDI